MLKGTGQQRRENYFYADCSAHRRNTVCSKRQRGMFTSSEKAVDAIQMHEMGNPLFVCHRVEYNVVHGKPFVTAWNGKQDDPEMGKFWFLYLKTGGDPKIVEECPADVNLSQNQEIILWYKHGPWSLWKAITEGTISQCLS
ncbi:hypothetical protein AVEN_223961-1 [Araneus ventricosus]|uniref:Uncharacterized protein n=1 Tax=Araneus ventricosus TaxID=182803 RepID=A0A4Y2M3D1_ARAVE|nr:hypothetical protein AVEN_223961-1 [Araneus ventricosus]